jgi:catechol 1,2-dioxygenase
MRGLSPATQITKTARVLLVRCMPTADVIRGPFYRRGAPWRTQLCSIDERGDKLSISGTVTTGPECRPVVDATLDIWQTNAKGLYSNFFGFGKRTNPRTFNLRGRVRSDAKGRYRFESIVPGRYPLFWPLTRPRHIHLIVTHPLYEPLTTQIYFEGDEYNDWDPWWAASLTIRLEPHGDDDSHKRHQHGVFDIALRPVQNT